MPKNKNEAGNTIIITDSNEQFELIHRVNLAELKAILAKVPGLLAEKIAKFDPGKNTEKPFKIVIGKGAYANVRLAKKISDTDDVQYVVVRKIQSQDNLDQKHLPKGNNVMRDAVIKMTKAELVLAEKIKELDIVSVAITHAQAQNKLNQDQLYQFLKIAVFGDLSRLHTLLDEGMAPEIKSEILVHFSKQIIHIVASLHHLGIYHRDLKLDNFLLLGNGEPVLADFGSAEYKNNNSWSRVSPSSCALYLPPFPIIHFSKGIELSQQRAMVHDRWALALTLLSLWQIKPANNADLVKCFRSIQNNDTAAVKEEKIKKVNDHYKILIDHLEHDEIFKTMPEQLRSFIRLSLSLNTTPLLDILQTVNLDALPVWHGKEELFNVLRQQVANDNDAFLEAQPNSLLIKNGLFSCLCNDLVSEYDDTSEEKDSALLDLGQRTQDKPPPKQSR